MLLVRVGIGSEGRDADDRAVRGVLVDGIGRRVAVADRPDIELVDVVDVDRQDWPW